MRKGLVMFFVSLLLLTTLLTFTFVGTTFVHNTTVIASVAGNPFTVDSGRCGELCR